MLLLPHDSNDNLTTLSVKTSLYILQKLTAYGSYFHVLFIFPSGTFYMVVLSHGVMSASVSPGLNVACLYTIQIMKFFNQERALLR